MAAAATDNFIKATRRFSTQLASPGIANDTVQTATLDSTVDLPTDTACVITIDRVDSDGKLTPDKEESVVGVISGSDITNMVRGFEGTAQAHASGAVVEVRYLAAQHNRLVDGILVEHNQDGTHKTLTGKTYDDPQITGTPTFDDEALSVIYPGSMSRQAIINGNFDVWQRGVTSTLADVTASYTADRFVDKPSRDGGTLPTLTRSRQIITSGAVPGSFYCSRLAMNGTGTNLGNNSSHYYRQSIENGTRFLCGVGKKVTLSFWARSDISNKRIAPTLQQYYGSGGSPSSIEYIKGEPITLTSTWTKYTYTFTTNTLSGKTFGTANDDALFLVVYYQWGSTFGNTYVKDSVTAETYGGSGYVEIAQVQLCAGDVALPFQPKSFEEELRACQRYFQTLPQTFFPLAYYATNEMEFGAVVLPVQMRIAPSLTAGTEVTDWQIFTTAAAAQTGFTFTLGSSSPSALLLKGAKNSHGLTGGVFKSNTTTNFLSAEL